MTTFAGKAWCYCMHHESACAFVCPEAEFYTDGLVVCVGDVVKPSQAEFEQICAEAGVPPPYYQVDLGPLLTAVRNYSYDRSH